jgi:sulfur-carrier protein adenylyltransferase/sulfurtransferase
MSLPPLVPPGPALPVDQVRRYSRHLIIPDVGMTGQRRLTAARVLVVGAGGLGSPALMYLAAAGVGTIGVLDDDVVEESNLQRQVVHGQSDLGRPKVDSARDTVAELNPHVQVVRHSERLHAGNALELFADYDLVLDGTDNFATRYLVGDACELLGLPYVWGSIYRFDGQVSVFWTAPPAGPDGTPTPGVTYRDLYPEPPPPGMVPSCAEGGVLGVLCAAIGAVMVTEAVKLICGIGSPLLGRLMVFDALEMTWRTVRVRPDPQRLPITGLIDYEGFCGVVSPAAAEAARDASVTAAELASWLLERDRGSRDFVLLDVREPGEREIVAIPGSVLLPVGRFRQGEALAELAELVPASNGPADAPRLVLHCKSGARSAEALALVRAAGYADAVHLAGGVLAWVEQVDPSLPSY